MARARPPDLVLMDLQLPGMDGIEALRGLRATRRPPAIPVVAVTAFAMGRTASGCCAAGFDGYLEKPISMRDPPRAGRARSSGRATDD